MMEIARYSFEMTPAIGKGSTFRRSDTGKAYENWIKELEKNPTNSPKKNADSEEIDI